jgi:hypothetical protein
MEMESNAGKMELWRNSLEKFYQELGVSPDTINEDILSQASERLLRKKYSLKELEDVLASCPARSPLGKVISYTINEKLTSETITLYTEYTKNGGSTENAAKVFLATQKRKYLKSLIDFSKNKKGLSEIHSFLASITV